MITRFRIEASNKDKEVLQAELQDAATSLMKLIAEPLVKEFPNGMWECTQDVTAGVPGNFTGRMIFAFKPEGPNGL